MVDNGYSLVSGVLQLAALVAVGVIEGLSHVNWRLFAKIVAWWGLSCIAVLLATAFLNWQGMAHKVQHDSVQVQADCLAK